MIKHYKAVVILTHLWLEILISCWECFGFEELNNLLKSAVNIEHIFLARVSYLEKTFLSIIYAGAALAHTCAPYTPGQPKDTLWDKYVIDPSSKATHIWNLPQNPTFRTLDTTIKGFFLDLRYWRSYLQIKLEFPLVYRYS